MTEPPRSFQHYEVLRRGDGSPWELGRGAMGITYKAFDVNLCCEVALKVVNSALVDHPDARDRFVREARAAAALRHRNVASVYHLGNDGEHFFYAMEFIDGETLDALVRRQGPLPVEAVLRVILQVSRALVAADRQRLVHRDLKPTNLMIVHEDADEDMTIKVIDFGLARPSTGADGAASLTVVGFVGTPQYASPEQLEERALDARSDIYSLGVTAWYLLTGQPPFSGSLATVCQQQLSHPPPWQQLPADFPGCVRSLLGYMLEKEPGKRPQTARALRAEIEACLEILPPNRTTPSRRTAGETRGFAGIIGKTTQSAGLDPRGSESFGTSRYTLLRLLEETDGTRVYQARDEQTGERLVTLRTLPVQLTRDARDRAALAEEIRLVQAASNPNLTQIFALEAADDDRPAFLVEEPVTGFSLRALLAARGGSLSLPDTLRLLEPAALAADHAEGCRLQHLDLTLHRVCIHFPGEEPGAEIGDTRSLLRLPLEQWPAWALKIHPFATERDTLEPATWAGDVTLVPGARPLSGAGSQPEELLVHKHLHRLASLTYELLGGTPGGLVNGGSPARNVSLPALNEAGNAVLAQALSDAPGFANCHGFHAALAAAGEGERRRATVPAVLPPPPSDRAALGSGAAAAKPVGRVRSRFSGGSASSGGVPVPGSTVGQARAESVAGFFQEHPEPPDDLVTGRTEGSAWDRLTMTGNEPVRPGRLLLGVGAVVFLFVIVFAGVLAVLLHGVPSKEPLHPSDGKLRRGIASSVRAERTPAPPVPRAETPPLENPPSQVIAVAAPRPTVRDVRAAASGSPPELKAAATPRVAAATPPRPSSAPQKLVTVHLDSVPQGVEIRAHGDLLGVTPLDARLPPGDHQLVTRYRNWPETRKTVHLDSGQTRVTVAIPLMPPGLVPINVPPDAPRQGTPPPALNPFLDRRAPRASPVRVEPAQPVAPPTEAAATPVRRPLPLEPFESGDGTQNPQADADPASPPSEDHD